MRLFVILCFFSFKLFSQLSLSPSSTIACNRLSTKVTLSVSSGVPPFSFTVQSSNCMVNYTTSSTQTTSSFIFQCADNYTISGVDANNMSLGDVNHSVILATHQNVELINDGGSDSLCYGSTLYLILDDSIFTFAQNPIINWSNGMTGTTALFTITSTTTFSAFGTYTAIMPANPAYVRQCSFEGTTKVAVITDPKRCLFSGENEKLIDGIIKVFPNPFQSSFKIKLVDMDIKSISISNTIGNTMFKLNDPKNEEEINLAFLPYGIYFLKAESSTHSLVTKIVKSIE